MANVPITTNIPWKLKEVESGDPKQLAQYMKKLIIHLNGMYSELANAINNSDAELQALKERYDDHTTHPPPA
jgi:hypothetical protein